MATRLNIALDTLAPAAERVDLLTVVVSTAGDNSLVHRLDRALHGHLGAELVQQRFKGIEGECVLFQTHGALPARNLLVAGIGDGHATGAWYRVAHATVSRASELRAQTAAVVLPEGHGRAREVQLVAEGAGLSAYSFDQLKSANGRSTRLQRLALIVPRREDGLRRALSRACSVAAATCYARDLVNLPAAIATPTYLAAEARRIAKAQRLRVRVLDTRGIERLGMGALRGVSQGSSQPPYFVELFYEPDGRPRGPRARRAPQRRVVALVGKGITFDSGGLSIKPAEAMQSQKRDMAGGAAVLATMSVVRDLEIPVAVRAYVPLSENMPGSRAIKPGDVVRAYNGRTIEVLNTDAEGRLVLADALAYAAAGKPDVIIDLATLTAAVRMALGNRYAAIMGTDPALVQALISAGLACAEPLWELPLVPEYRSDIDSSVADIKNIGEGGAGTIIGGLFLREFVGNVRWAHIDFSSTAVAEKPFPCQPRGATGFGVRTLLHYLTNV